VSSILGKIFGTSSYTYINGTLWKPWSGSPSYISSSITTSGPTNLGDISTYQSTWSTTFADGVSCSAKSCYTKLKIPKCYVVKTVTTTDRGTNTTIKLDRKNSNTTVYVNYTRGIGGDADVAHQVVVSYYLNNTCVTSSCGGYCKGNTWQQTFSG